MLHANVRQEMAPVDGNLQENILCDYFTDNLLFTVLSVALRMFSTIPCPDM